MYRQLGIGQATPNAHLSAQKARIPLTTPSAASAEGAFGQLPRRLHGIGEGFILTRSSSGVPSDGSGVFESGI